MNVQYLGDCSDAGAIIVQYAVTQFLGCVMAVTLCVNLLQNVTESCRAHRL